MRFQPFASRVSSSFASTALLFLAGCATTSAPVNNDIVRRPGSFEATARRQTVLSPDGTKLFFNKKTLAGAEIWKQTGPTGTAEKFATDSMSLAIEEISPDGATLALLTTDLAGVDNGLELRSTSSSDVYQVEPFTKGRQVLGIWFDNAASNLYYMITSTIENHSWFMQMDLKTHTKKVLFNIDGLVQELDCWGDGLFLFKREGAGAGSELLVWLGEETGVVAFKPPWMPRAKDVRFADKPDHFLVLKTDDDGVNRVYAADEKTSSRVSDLDLNVDQFIIDHRRYRVYTTAHVKGVQKFDALDAKSYLPYAFTELPAHLDGLKIDRTSRYGRFLSFSTKDGFFIYDWKETGLQKWLASDVTLP